MREQMREQHTCPRCTRVVRPTAKGNAPAHKSWLSRYGYCPGTGKPTVVSTVEWR